MQPGRWNEIEALLQAALDLQPEARGAFLDAACGSDRQLRAQVQSLLDGETDAAILSRSPWLDLAKDPEATRAEFIGRTISHYRITGWIGSGGMGDVFEARDERLQRTVALKVLGSAASADSDRIRRLDQEALAASRLNHPNIITIFETFHGADAHFIATERIEGPTLRELLTERLTVEKALDIAIQIATALQAAHTAWIIHRDIKPENVMVRSDGLVKVLDFGIALESTPADLSPADPSGAVLGTTSYMSPEQLRGEPLDGRTDLYSLGVVMLEMLTGRRVRAGRHADHVSEVPKSLERIVRRLLQENRDQRYGSAGDLLRDLNVAKRRIESTNARRIVALGVLSMVAAVAVIAVAAALSIRQTWQERVLRDGHFAAARQAVFSPDGRRLVSCGEDGQVIVWDVQLRQRIATLPGPKANKVAFSSGGQWIAVGGTEGSVAIWEASRLVRVRLQRDFHSDVSALTFSPGDRYLAAAANEGCIIWRTDSWTPVYRSAHGASHGDFVFSADARRALLSTNLTRIDIPTRSQAILDEPDRSTNWIAISPDRSLVASISSMGEISFYAADPALDRLHLIERLPAHQDHGRAIAFSNDGRIVASGAEDIILWDAATRSKLARFECSAIVWSLAFSPDGKTLISSHADGSLVVWDIAERKRVVDFTGHIGAVRAVAFAPDGRRVATAGEDRSVVVWNIATGRRDFVRDGHPTRVTGVGFAGRQLASIDQWGDLNLWNLDSGRPLSIVPPDPRPVYALAVSPDGRLVASSEAIFDAKTGAVVADFYFRSAADWRQGQIYGAAFFPDGRRVVCVTNAGAILIYDIARHDFVARHDDRRRTFIAVAVSPDGRTLLTGEDEGAVRVWALDPLREVAVLGRHQARVKSVAFSSDGMTAASAGDDKAVNIWNVPKRTLIERAGTHASPVYAVAFSPDGKMLVSGEHDGSVRVYTRQRTLWSYRLE